MIKQLKPKSEFTRNVLTLMTGTTIAQAIPIAITPLLTRIYSPEDFGIFSLYIGITSTLAVMATGRYELAIMLPKKDNDALNIVILSILIAFFVSFLTLFVVVIFNNEIVLLLNSPEITNWLFFIPLTILLTGIYQSLNYWNNRRKKYKRLALSKVIKSSVSSITNLGMGLKSFTSSGLIIGSLMGQFITTTALVRQAWKENKDLKGNISKLKMISLMREYKNFPSINLPHAFLNVFSTSAVVIVLSYFFQSSITGYYALANRVIASPMGIITGSYGQVFLQKIVELSSTDDREKEAIFFKNSVLKLLIFSFPIFLILFVFSVDIFSYIFGEKWGIAGYYAKILVPMLYVRFTGSIVSSIAIVHNKQKKALIIELINTILRISSILVGGIFNSVTLGFILFSSSSFIITTIRIFWYFSIVNRRNKGDI